MTTKRIRTSDILGSNYYTYELSSSNYTPELNGTITITCNCKNVYGDNIANKTLTLYQNGTSKGTQTTNNNGVATWSITCSTAGLQKFNIKDTSIEVLVDDSLHDITLRFEDDCSDDAGLSNYGDSIPFNGESSNEWNTYHSNNFHVYELSGSGGYFSGREILPLHGVNNGRVRIKFYLLEDSPFNQLCIFCTDQTPSSTETTYPYGTRVRGDSLFQYFTLTNEETIYDETPLDREWFYLEAIKNGRTWIMNLYDDTLDLIASETKTNLATMTDPNWYLAIQTETEYSMVAINEIVADNITDGIVPYSGVQKSSDGGMKTISPRNGEIDLNDYSANGNYIYIPPVNTSGIDTYHFPSDITVDDAFTLIVENYPYSEYDSVVHQTLYPIPQSYADPATVYIRYTYDNWTKVGEVDIDLPSTITLSASKQKLDENESFKIYANAKDVDGNAVSDKTLTLMYQYESYSNEDMWATGWVRDVGFYVNDTIFKEDWSCKFKVNSTPDHTGLQLYISSEQRILFSTLGATSTSEIEITCSDNTITINVDGTDYGTTYTQNANGTKVGFFTHEDYTVSIKDFISTGILYKDCGSQTTDSNGNCSWSFNDGLPQGIYSFYINDVNIDVFVGLCDVIKDSLNNKQDKLVSCINIRTLEGVDLIGNGDITFDVSYDDPYVIFEDKGNACGVSNYTTNVLLESGTAPIFTVKYSTTYNAYYYDITTDGTGMQFIPINALTGITDNFKLQVDIMKTESDRWTALGFAESEGNGFVYGGAGSYWEGHEYQSNRWRRTLNHNTSNPPQSNTWYTYELIKEGNSITVNCWDITHTTNYSSITRTWTNGTNYYGLTYGNDIYFKNIKAQYLNYSTSPIQLSTDKTELSYYDNESATLTAIYESGATIGLYNANTMTKIGNFTETTSGTYTYTYNSNGDGDINLVAKVGPTTSEPILIEDCLFYGININAFDIPENATFSSDNEKITATTSTSGEKLVYFNHDFNQNDNFLFESEIAEMGVYQVIGMNWNDVNYYGGQYGGTDRAYAHLTNSDTWISHTFAVGDKYTVIKKNGTTSAYINNDLISSASSSYNTTFKVGFFLNQNRTQYYKNIKIKLLNDDANIEQTENTIKLGNGILQLIDNTLDHMITNWEDYE